MLGLSLSGEPAGPQVTTGPSRPRRRLTRTVIAGVSALALLTGVSVLASSAALAARPVRTHSTATPDPARPVITPNGLFNCGHPGPVMLGTINWRPPSGDPRSAISVITMSFTASRCLIVTGPLRGGIISTVNVAAAFPIHPNPCPFLPQNYVENLSITYGPVIRGNHLYNLNPSYATVQVHPAAFWKFTHGLVGGSFATANAFSQFRPVIAAGVCNATVGVSVMTLAPTSLNIMRNF
jgi:hypothetical protein